MSGIPPEIKLTAGLPDDDGRRVQDLLQEFLRRAAEQSGVTIVNIFQNPGTVVIQDQSAKSSGCATQIGGTEIMSEKIQIHAMGSIVNYKSNLNNVQMLLDTSPPNQTPEEDRVRQALKEFSDKLAAADARSAEDAMLLSHRLEELATQVAKPSKERKNALLSMSAIGLKQAVSPVTSKPASQGRIKTSHPELIYL
jgi:hypothetical protein